MNQPDLYVSLAAWSQIAGSVVFIVGLVYSHACSTRQCLGSKGVCLV